MRVSESDTRYRRFLNRKVLQNVPMVRLRVAKVQY